MSQTFIPAMRLANQGLLQSQCQSVKELVSFMGAMQAQDYMMSKWAVGVRLQGIKETEVEAAINKGEVLRTHVMRPTWHLVAAEDIRWMLALTGPKIKTSTQSRDRDLGLTEATIEKSKEIIIRALSGNKHLTREELSIELENAGIAINQYRITHLMMHAELDSIICSGALKGKKQTYALVEERVPVQKVLTRDEALERIAFKYFSSHSPATIEDFMWWSGLSKTDARKAIEMNNKHWVAEIINGKTYHIAHNLPVQPYDCIHLLPAFDEYIISYKDRTDVLSLTHHSKAISSNGIFRPIIVENGMIIGLWKKTMKKNKPVVETSYFDKPSKQMQEKVQEKIAEFERFF